MNLNMAVVRSHADAQANKRLERTRHERASLLSNLGEPFKRSVGHLLFGIDYMRRSSLIGITVGVPVFLLALVTGVFLHWRFTYYRVWLSSTSPNQKYTVELTGDKGRGGFLIYSVVKYDVLVNGEPLIRDRLLHYGDSMDISFELAYPEHAWIDGSTLRFWSNRHRREDNLDKLLISNNTDKVIRFLRIKAWDMFFVFDVHPRSQLKLSFTHRSEGKGISVEGLFDDGALIDYGVG